MHKTFIELVIPYSKDHLDRTDVPCVVAAAASQAWEEEHRVKKQSLKHIAALAGADTLALAVETDEVANQMAECLMDLKTLVRTAFDIPEDPEHHGRVYAMVTKVLSRAKMLANPKALEKVKPLPISVLGILIRSKNMMQSG